MGESRTVVVYFSWSGITRAAAQAMAQRIGADSYELVPVKPYPSSYDDTTYIAGGEVAAEARPEIEGELPDLSAYETVVLAMPLWWSAAPRIIFTFIEAVDLVGKKVLTFVTYGTLGMSGIDKAIRKALPGADVVDGLAVPGKQASTTTTREEIDSWLTKNGLTILS